MPYCPSVTIAGKWLSHAAPRPALRDVWAFSAGVVDEVRVLLAGTYVSIQCGSVGGDILHRVGNLDILCIRTHADGRAG